MFQNSQIECNRISRVFIESVCKSESLHLVSLVVYAAAEIDVSTEKKIAEKTIDETTVVWRAGKNRNVSHHAVVHLME